MNHQKIQAAANLLLDARRSGRLLAGMPPELAPADSAEAYAIQHQVTVALGRIGGWKVGAKGPDAQPSCAPLPESLMFRDPHSFSIPKSQRPGVEAEVAVRLAHDLPQRAAPYLPEDVLAATGSVLPAIEIVGSRFADPAQENPLSMLADSLANTAFVFGKGTEGGVNIDQTVQPAKLYFNSVVVADVVGGNPAGDVWRLLAWLANHVAAHHGGLQAGQIITTGSCTGLLTPEPGTTVRASFEGLGEVTAHLT
jgi:2-keto-4-pentenoate hydratase